MQVNGVFRRSKSGDSDLLFPMVVLVVWVVVAAYGLVKATSRFGYNIEVLLPIAIAQVLLVAVLGILWRRFNTTYRIESGHIIALTRGGKERWTESLAALQSVAIVRQSWRNDGWLYLKWPGKSRHIELFDTLAAELHV
jgi:Na+/proline symporter